MARRRKLGGGGLDVWPGYVDALSTLLMVVTFVLLVFVVGQAFLSVSLSQRQHSLDSLQAQLAELSRMLSLEQGKNRTLSGSIATLTAERDRVQGQVTALGGQLAALNSQLSQKNDQLAAAGQATQAQGNQITALNTQLAQLNAQLAAIMKALDIAKVDLATRDQTIADLGNKLNLALAQRVTTLERYRSEFFGRMRDILRDQKGVEIVGDRFVFQSEVLFPQGSADLTPEGTRDIAALARTFRKVSGEIPRNVPWILRVDGHADRQPIHGKFVSNWELSAERAITVVRVLIAQGIDPHHLAATGFADYQPLDSGNTAAAFARNRRIEFRLTDR